MDPQRRRWVLLGIGSVIAAASVLSAISFGAVHVPLPVIWGILANKLSPGFVEESWTRGTEAIIWEIRLPRCLLAAAVGAGLSVVGATLQAVTRNPLADPHLLGISSGGAFGAIFALLHTGMFLGTATVPAMAFAGALSATFLVLGVSRFTGSTTADKLVLTGVAVSFIVMAAANALVFLGDPRAAHTVVFWMLGGFGLAQWDQLLFPYAALFACSLYFFLKSGDLNAITVGDETASTFGISVRHFRIMIFSIGALLTGVLVAYSGIVGFVGLMVPHIARLFVGGDHFRVLPTAAVIGAIFLLWADIASRTIVAPEELPVGVVTGLVGGIFFVWLLQKRKF